MRERYTISAIRFRFLWPRRCEAREYLARHAEREFVLADKHVPGHFLF